MAVRPEYQGLGIGKALVSEAVKRMFEIEGDRAMYLHTQTWSYKAIGIYHRVGFFITRETGLAGYENNEVDKAAGILKEHLKTPNKDFVNSFD